MRDEKPATDAANAEASPAVSGAAPEAIGRAGSGRLGGRWYGGREKEQPAAPVFIDGKKAMTLRGPTVVADFQKIVIDYIERRFGSGGAGRTAAE